MSELEGGEEEDRDESASERTESERGSPSQRRYRHRHPPNPKPTQHKHGEGADEHYTYVFKLMNSSRVLESGESEKVLLLMESGVRLHTTVYMRDKSNTPSGFTLKLRKHIRTRRLEDVRQLGYDRIILFQFGLGENANYVILELYAQGNILLTDANFTVLTLLRSHSLTVVGVCDKRRICHDLIEQIRIAVEDKDTVIYQFDS
ncbi:hypothetical protein HN873_063700 [Arachis hypogaea]